MALALGANVSPNDASILSMIAARPGVSGGGTAAYRYFISRLQSPLAQEIARVLINPSEKGVTEEAQKTADAMRRWYAVKRERIQQSKQDLQSRRRRLKARSARPTKKIQG